MIKENNICKTLSKIIVTITIIINSVEESIVKETGIVVMISILKWENKLQEVKWLT